MPHDFQSGSAPGFSGSDGRLRNARRWKMPPSAKCQATEAPIRLLPVSSIRRDGQTQHRIEIDAAVVDEYATLMKDGVVFPPIRVWWDGRHYWLTDGFQRIAAAECAGLDELPAEVRNGSLSDAQWDSYAANSAHGVRRTAVERQRVIQLALRHSNAAQLSNMEVARHLAIPEATVRRWRKRLSSSGDEDDVRIVTRGQTTYRLTTTKIGKSSNGRKAKSRKDLRTELALMKQWGSPAARRLLTIVGNWVFGCAEPTKCINAIEQVIKGWPATMDIEDLGTGALPPRENPEGRALCNASYKAT